CGAAPLGAALGEARALRDRRARPLELGGELASFSFALRALAPESRSALRKVPLPLEQLLFFISETDLIAFTYQVRAFSFDSRGARFGEGDPGARGLLVGSDRRGFALGDEVGESLDLAIDAHDLGREVRTLLGCRPKRGLVPAERATAWLVPDGLVLVALRGLLAQRFDPRPDLARAVVHWRT